MEVKGFIMDGKTAAFCTLAIGGCGYLIGKLRGKYNYQNGWMQGVADTLREYTKYASSDSKDNIIDVEPVK